MKYKITRLNDKYAVSYEDRVIIEFDSAEDAIVYCNDNNLEYTTDFNFSFLSTLLLATSLILPTESPAIPKSMAKDPSYLKKYLVAKVDEQTKLGNTSSANYYDLMQSVIDTESTWRPSIMSSKDSSGNRAYGLFQFRKRTIDDINRRYGTNYTESDALNPETAVEMYRKYYNMLVKYHRYYKNKKNLKSIPNIRDIAMMYNQGLLSWDPSNVHHSDALKYWGKINGKLKTMKSVNFSNRVSSLFS